MSSLFSTLSLSMVVAMAASSGCKSRNSSSQALGAGASKGSKSGGWEDMTTDDKGGSSTCAQTPSRCSYKDKVTGLSWSKQLDNLEWEDAKDRCDGLNYNGQSGWRLPKIEDLTTAVEHHIETTQSDDFVGNFNSWFWSDSTEHSNDFDEDSIKRSSRDTASFVNLKDGTPKVTNTYNTNSVICVR